MADIKLPWHKPNHAQREIQRRLGRKLKHQCGYPTKGALMIAFIEFMELHHGRATTRQCRAAFDNIRRQPALLSVMANEASEYMSLWEGICIQRAEQSSVRGESTNYIYQFASNARETIMSHIARNHDALKRLKTGEFREGATMQEKYDAGLLTDAEREDHEIFSEYSMVATKVLEACIRVAEHRGLLKERQSAKPTEEDLGIVSDDLSVRRAIDTIESAKEFLAKRSLPSRKAAGSNDDNDDGSESSFE